MFDEFDSCFCDYFAMPLPPISGITGPTGATGPTGSTGPAGITGSSGINGYAQVTAAPQVVSANSDLVMGTIVANSGIVNLSDDNKQIIIAEAGVYMITASWSCSLQNTMALLVNGVGPSSLVYLFTGTITGGAVPVNTILPLSQGDIITLSNATSDNATFYKYNSFGQPTSAAAFTLLKMA